MIPRLKQTLGRTAGELALLLSLTLASPGLTAPWVQTTSLPDTYIFQSLVYASGYLYQAGGGSGNNGITDGTNVFYSKVYNDGTIGSWNVTTSLPVAVYEHAGIAANGFVYVLGGANYSAGNITLSSNVYYAKINADGSLGSWQTANPLPDTLQFLSASVWSNRIYVIGGFGGPDEYGGAED